MRLLPSIALLALLAGCGPPLVWDRPQTSDAIVHADVQDCRRMARQQAFAETWPGPSFRGFPARGYYDRRPGYFYHDPFAKPFFEREARESSLHDFCMRARGYRLAPLEQASGGS